MTASNGDKYVGEMKNTYENGKMIKHGKGIYTSSNGEKYVGKWKDDKMHGKGTCTYSDGDKYVGEYKNGIFHGNGTYTYSDGENYVGKWKDDKKHGKGTYTYSNGDKYVGEFIHDIFHGKGTFTGRNISYVGIWQNNIEEKGKYYIGEKNYIEIDITNDRFNPILTFKFKNGNYYKTYTIRCKYKYNKNDSVKYIKNVLKIKGLILKLGSEITDFCNKICNFIKFQRICKRYFMKFYKKKV